MALVINTNILSLEAQNNLNKSQSALGTAIERLSSGLRINSAKDDAAGQAIANRFTANINGLAQASRNANDGISLAQTTEGALNEVNDNLQNIRRLAVQAQNGTNSESDLQSIQDEITQRLDEINRISAQTDFNGVKVLSKDQSLTIQVGADDGQTIGINLRKMDAGTLGLSSFSVMTKGTRVGDAVSVGTMVTPTAGGKMVAVKAPAAGTLVSGTSAAGQAGYYIKNTDAKTGVVSYTSATIGADGSVAVGKPVTDLQTPLATLDKALSQVDDLRSGLGAVQNRFDSVISNLDSTVTNLSASRSRIQDADYATEVSDMSRAQILQQAGTAVLAKANQSTQNVLSLLR
ncbi:flagellin [Edwardsiella ictaluri]|uniref:flagellin N-terminal helical domain-containing protein n=1 Tax=Edwardsiella ictaluri TaxID=67780 RepID=UPI0018DDB152|nr:flagellin [Edwardsiella ictaluri]QPW30425.1 flagellin FliC [Edwardsiella ictaluri]UYB60552.1 flagellin [Edwardsiella ictaluri]UYB63780.1 flagellin [Edwardsiella ictaluri]WJH21442.1 flagellin FliC [Edwardsiella ictaluri]BEH99385.1 FliC/FljB family flagellin [Edwardsiella ictaluri]